MKPQTATPANRASVESKEFRGNQKPPAWGGFVKLLLNSRKLGLASVPKNYQPRLRKTKEFQKNPKTAIPVNRDFRVWVAVAVFSSSSVLYILGG